MPINLVVPHAALVPKMIWLLGNVVDRPSIPE